MSIVDTWNWDKIDTSVYDKPIKMTADMKAQTALRDFYERHGIFPNRITMGFYLVSELHNQYFPKKSFEDLRRELEENIRCEYEGIPVKIDYDNPDNLEVGYMVKWTDDRY